VRPARDLIISVTIPMGVVAMAVQASSLAASAAVVVDSVIARAVAARVTVDESSTSTLAPKSRAASRTVWRQRHLRRT